MNETDAKCITEKNLKKLKVTFTPIFLPYIILLKWPRAAVCFIRLESIQDNRLKRNFSSFHFQDELVAIIVRYERTLSRSRWRPRGSRLLTKVLFARGCGAVHSVARVSARVPPVLHDLSLSGDAAPRIPLLPS